MKLLFRYFLPYHWLVLLVLLLASINIGFSLIDPIIFGKLVTLASNHQVSATPPGAFDWQRFLFINENITDQAGKTIFIYGLVWLLVGSISVAMVSRIAKAFQDYFLNLITQKFGATIFPLLDTLLLETGAIRYSAWQARASSKKILYTVFIALKAI
ncbi:MAG: hypothetical protein ACKV1O_17890 [Saprospiraceae bacterium]